MGSYMNFKNFGDTVQPDGSGETPMDNYPLARQSSVYSLTFDEFQSTLAGPGKDFGSMNMEDLLKSIWTAEETQAMSSCPGSGDGMAPGGNLHRQGSLTLPRTLSQKTVDEVWRDVLKETVGAKDGSTGGGSNLEVRQPTLGEMTLEDFLVRAGVVREDIQPSWTANNNGIYGLAPASGFSIGSTIGFQQPPRNQGVLGNRLAENNNLVHNLQALEKNISGVISLQQQPRQPQPLFPKQTIMSLSSPMQPGNNGKLASPGVRGQVAEISNPLNNTRVQGGQVVMGTLHNGGSTVAGRSPGNLLTSDTIAKSDVDTYSLSPSPYPLREGGRGRRSSTSLEKVVERRRKRMMKNKESAARSRARKQAYTLELEAEVAKLREMNQEFRKKQAEYMEMQKNQISESTNMPRVGKRICLRRLLTGPW
ncbi:ABSCISIC ACID-INSENSITIVE 5 7 [Olea europaea subsp. europaea]|uniref:ABSCISIC ACID-INSENSITIVE 5 7 n=2 Tax=Olea europaea subsp. europaea TaxID=158383 RepID=A0A8S0PZN4_OLEEU|nr:ABSCISIC ACID-INSENSITIVE 5 7 [Olea europaea subsp. europaea]